MSDAPEEVEPVVAAPSAVTKIRGPWSLMKSFEHGAKPKSVTVNGKKLAAKEFSYAKGVLTLTPDAAPTGIVSIVVD